VTLPTALLPFVAEPARAVLLIDFDGSIAPIVDDPAAARPLPAIVDALRDLTPKIETLAVVSGRTVEFLGNALPIDGLILVGLYGLERRVDGTTIVDARAEPWIAPIGAAATEAEDALPGLLVERKGELCVTIHFRTTPERGTDARAVAYELARKHGIEAPQSGRMAVELRPPVPVDKGTVVRELTRGAAAAAFAGDDAGDIPAFVALVDLARAGKLEHAVRIGVLSPEAPPEILDADIVVDGPDGLAVLLHDLAGAISPHV
jgi:trehalose 6-phosphate phosphatase